MIHIIYEYQFVRFKEEKSTVRGLNFDNDILMAFLELIHGYHDVVAGKELKPTINH